MILTDEFLFESLFVDYDSTYYEQTGRMLEELYLLDIQGFELEETFKYISEAVQLSEAIRPGQMVSNAKEKMGQWWEKILDWIQTMVAKIAVFINKFTENRQKIADMDMTFKTVLNGKQDKVQEYLKSHGLSNKPYIQATGQLIDKGSNLLQQLTNLQGDQDASMKMTGKDNLNAAEIDKNTTTSGWVVMENKLLEILQELTSKKKVIKDEDLVDFSITPAAAHALLVLKSKKLHGMMTTVYKNYKNKTYNVERLDRGAAGTANSAGKSTTYNYDGLKHAKGAVSLTVRMFAIMISLFSTHMSQCSDLIAYTNTKMQKDKAFSKGKK
jgi:hypothetical protein